MCTDASINDIVNLREKMTLNLRRMEKSSCNWPQMLGIKALVVVVVIASVVIHIYHMHDCMHTYMQTQ